jgi:hypothetical protein
MWLSKSKRMPYVALLDAQPWLFRTTLQFQAQLSGVLVFGVSNELSGCGEPYMLCHNLQEVLEHARQWHTTQPSDAYG